MKYVVVENDSIKNQTHSCISHQMKVSHAGPQQHMLVKESSMIVDILIQHGVELLSTQSHSITLLLLHSPSRNKGVSDSKGMPSISHNCIHQPSLNNDLVLKEALVPCIMVSQCCLSLSCSDSCSMSLSCPPLEMSQSH